MSGKRLHDAEMYEVLAAVYAKEGTGVTSDNVGAYRTKAVRAGDFLYLSCYPLWLTLPTDRARDALSDLKAGRAEKKAMAKYARYNNARRCREFEMLVHANFDANDLHVAATYEVQDYDRRDGLEYRDRDQAKREVSNYIRRVKRLLGKRGCDLADFRWICCTVTKESRHETNPNPDSHHHHILMHGVPEVLRGEVERLWGFGYCNADRLQPNDKGIAAMAGYIARQEGSYSGERAGEKSYRTSRNIVRPQVRVSDKKISRRRVSRIAADVRANAAEIFRKVYPGWRLVEEPSVAVSDFVAGAYIRVKLRRCEHAGAETQAERLRHQRGQVHGA